MASNVYGIWQARKAPAYTKMPIQDQGNELNAARSSCEQSLQRLDEERFTSWPNSSIGDSYQAQTNDNRASAADLFFPMRVPTQHKPGFSHRIKLMCTKFPCRDVRYLVGISFTIGSVFFVANGFFLLQPLIAPDTDFRTDIPYATPASSVIGTFIFLVGSYVAVLEALNLRREETVITEGIPLRQSMESIPKNGKIDYQAAAQITSRDNSTDSSQASQPSSPGIIIPIPAATSQPALLGSPSFIYLPTTEQLLSVYAKSILFHASMTQLIGAIIFSIATLTSLPGVLNPTSLLALHLLNLLPATLGGALFLIASLLQILDSQNRIWYRPEMERWEWWTGVFNAVGSLGFLLAGLLPWVVEGEEWGVVWGTLAAFWGSWAFLLGSAVQWWGVMENHL
ncbi:hypothetical protein EG329_000149 [Mollisiaceae sp. DMI_Dod_QoI]|nr:hypothetical protein EG329_000149 [Helotiales sp. DMI_Dod_QoI]